MCYYHNAHDVTGLTPYLCAKLVHDYSPYPIHGGTYCGHYSPGHHYEARAFTYPQNQQRTSPSVLDVGGRDEWHI